MSESLSGGPGNWFIEELCVLRRRCGTPSYGDLIAISRRLGALYGPTYAALPVLSKTVLSNVLNGQRKGAPTWTFVASLVLSCQYHGHKKACLLRVDPGPTTLPDWNERRCRADIGMRAAGAPLHEALPYNQVSVFQDLPHPVSQSQELGAVSMSLRPGDRSAFSASRRLRMSRTFSRTAAEGDLVARLTRRYTQGHMPYPPSPPGPGGRSGGPATGPAGGPGNYLAAPTPAAAAPPPSPGPTVLPGPAGGEQTPRRRLPTVDELLAQISDDHLSATPSYRRTSSGAASYRGEPPHPRAPRVDSLLGPVPARSRRHGPAQDLLGDHGVDLHQAAEDGDADAACRLGVLFTCALLFDEAEPWLAFADHRGDPVAGCLLSIEQPWRRTIAAEIAYDLALPHTDASAGDQATCAEVYYRAAADCGHVGAMYRLAVLCRARGTEDEAAYWFNQAGNAGHPDAPRLFEQVTADMIRDGFDEHHLRTSPPHQCSDV